jgi:hypothetical protein
MTDVEKNGCYLVLKNVGTVHLHSSPAFDARRGLFFPSAPILPEPIGPC